MLFILTQCKFIVVYGEKNTEMLACLTEKKKKTIIHNLLVSFVQGKKCVTWHLQASFLRKHPRELAKDP